MMDRIPESEYHFELQSVGRDVAAVIQSILCHYFVSKSSSNNKEELLSVTESFKLDDAVFGMFSM